MVQPSEAQNAEQCAAYFRALGDPIRLQMIRALQSGPKSVSDLSLLLEIELANASHHLRVLYHAGLVTSQRDGKFIYYRLSQTIRRPESRPADKALDFGCCKLDLGS
jgi:DNA-binding transcriptional ArsR family regulator